MKPLLHLGFRRSRDASERRKRRLHAQLIACLASLVALAGCGSSGDDLSKIGAATYRGPVASTGNTTQTSGQVRAGSQKAKVSKSSKKALTAPVEPSTLATGAEAVGNAFYVDNRGHLLTTWEQVRDCRRVAILDSFELRHVTVMAGNPLSGMAVLDAGETTEVYALFRATAPVAGEGVTTFAHPILDGLFMPLEHSKGTLRSSIDPERANAILETTAIREGQSTGGPIVDDRGNVIGIAVSRLNPEWPTEMGYGIGTEMILRFASSAGVGVWTEEMGGQGDASALQGAAPYAGDYTVPVICFR